MNVQEKITVCIPSYNRANTISNSINSILKQSYENIEILIIDNASTDNTKEVVESFDDPRIKYLYFPDLLEVNYNFMRAISCASTEIVCLFHSDDYYFPNIIEEELKYLVESDVGAVFSKMIPRKIDMNGSIEISNCDTKVKEYEVIRYNHKKFFEESLKRGIPVACPTLMTKKSVIKEVGLLDKKEGLISDISLWLPIARKCDIIDLQTPLMFYGTSDDQLSHKIHHKRIVQSPQFKVLDKELSDFSDLVSKESINKYNYRKMKDYIHISKNSFFSGKIFDGLRYSYNAISSLITRYN